MDDIDHAARGEELLKKAEKKINCRSFPVLASNSNYEDPAQLLRKSAISFRLAKSWDKAGSVFVKLSEHRMKFNGKFEAAMAYKDAARCYQKTSTEGAIPCLKQAITILTEIGTSYSLAAMYCKKAIEIYEDIAKQSLNDNLLKYEVGGHLLNAGICQLCQGDFVAIANSLKRYQDLYPTFSTTREYKFLADLAASIDEKDVAKFTRVFNEFEKVTPLHSWKSTLLLKVKDVLKAKEMEKLKVKDALKAKEMEKDESKS